MEIVSELKKASYMESELPSIEEEYERLLSLHRRLHDLEEPEVESPKTLCQIPHIYTSSIKMVHPPYNITICLPPKCGTSNWQKAMNVLEKDSQQEPPPRRSGEKYWEPEDFVKYEDVYEVLRNVDILDSADRNLIADWTKILNTRNGFFCENRFA